MIEDLKDVYIRKLYICTFDKLQIEIKINKNNKYTNAYKY